MDIPGPAPEELAEVERFEASEKIRLETIEREIKERQEVEEAIIRKQRHEEWVSITYFCDAIGKSFHLI
jgi:hypothetical protein